MVRITTELKNDFLVDGLTFDNENYLMNNTIAEHHHKLIDVELVKSVASQSPLVPNEVSQLR